MAEVKITPSDNLTLKLRSLRPGDTGLLADGVYAGGVYLSRVSGLPGAPITLRAANKGKAIVRGGTLYRKDALALYQSKWWNIEGIVFKEGLRAGLYLGDSDNANVTDCICDHNATQGLLAGSTSFLKVLRCGFFYSGQQHGAYVSGAATDIEFNDCESAFNAQCAYQFNSQAAADLLRKWRLLNCRGNDNGRLLKGAAVNVIGGAEGLIDGCQFERNKAGGISFSANGQPGGSSTNNDIRNTTVKFLAGEGRTCVQQTGGGVLRLADSIVQSGKATVPPVKAVPPSIIEQVNVTVLPVATTVPDAEV
jgi:hypothetical protein